MDQTINFVKCSAESNLKGPFDRPVYNVIAEESGPKIEKGMAIFKQSPAIKNPDSPMFVIGLLREA